jgi:WD40 repeat protein
VTVWEARTGGELLTLEGHDDPVSSLAYSPDGKRIVSGSWERTILVWDAQQNPTVAWIVLDWCGSTRMGEPIAQETEPVPGSG